MTNAPDSTREQFTLEWAGREGATVAGARSVNAYVPPGQSHTFTLPVPESAAAADRIVLRGDDEPFDNTVFVAPPRQLNASVVWLGPPAGNDRRAPLLFLSRAFADTSRVKVDVESQDVSRKPGSQEPEGSDVGRGRPIPPSGGRASLAAADLIFVAGSLTTDAAADVHAAVAQGRTAVVVLGRDPQPALATLLGADVHAAEAPVAHYAMFGEIDFRHPLFAPFADQRFSDFTKIHVWHYRRIDASALPDASVAARFDSGDPAVVDLPLGKGRIVLLTTSWQPDDNELAVSSKFVPLMWSLLELSGATLAAPIQVSVGGVVPVPDGATTVRRPDGTAVPLARGSRQFAATDVPGGYEFSGAGRATRFVVNLDANESRTTPLSLEQLEELGVPVKPAVTPATATRGPSPAALETENRQKLWRWLILATLAVVTVESLIAGWTLRRSPPADAGSGKSGDLEEAAFSGDATPSSRSGRTNATGASRPQEGSAGRTNATGASRPQEGSAHPTNATGGVASPGHESTGGGVMIDPFLQGRLDRAFRRHRWLALFRTLAASWAFAALLGAVAAGVERATGHAVAGVVPLVLLTGIGVAVALVLVQYLRPRDYRWMARQVEAAFPSLKGVLLTAVENPETPSDFLRHRVVREAIARSQEQDWRDAIPRRRLAVIHALHAVAAICLVATLVTLHRLDALRPPRVESPVAGGQIRVSPGNVTLERGESLVVTARFREPVPANARLVVRENGVTRDVPLERSLGDPVFGTTFPAVQGDFTYQLESSAGRSGPFAVKVFEPPRLVRADAVLTYPDYTHTAPRRIEDTTRLSAVEGTHVDLALQLNKPVTTATLVARDAAKTTVPLVPQPGKPNAALTAWVPAQSATYDLVLVDADGRTNKAPIPFIVEVQPNRPPELHLTSPRGDTRPSALEEMTFDGTVWDDFGTVAYGLSYVLPNGDTKSVELGRDVPAKQKQPFKHVLSFEALGARPDDLIEWHLWADDMGPDGKLRRTQGDLFFAEVRPYDEVFREDQMAAGQQQQGGMSGDETRKLTEQQKQIINATWKLQRDGKTAHYRQDLDVVRQSQAQALEQAREAQAEARSPRQAAQWQGAIREMGTAVTQLAAAGEEPGPLVDAVPPERAAYQQLLKLQARETAVTRGQRNRGGGGGAQANQRQMDQLDLQQAENRYETQREAQAPAKPRQQEQLALMSRLQDLARRQQDVNDRLKELQTALQEAKTEPERAELRERLKRLEDEQRQMLADADDLRQRMDNAESRSELSSQMQQLDDARDNLQRSADASAGGSVAQALASGTRAQRQLQQARDDLRRQSSSQLADDLRQMRSEARDLAHQQQQLEQSLGQNTEASAQTRKSLADEPATPDAAKPIAEQRERWNKLMDQARQLSESAESAEPLVSKRLYDSVRKASQADEASVAQVRQDLLSHGDLTYGMRDRLDELAKDPQAGKALAASGELLKQGETAAAGRALRQAGAQMEELRDGVEKAAAGVLGDDAEQLKLARSELDQLTEQLKQEEGAGGAATSAAQKSGPAARAPATAGEANLAAGDKSATRASRPQGSADQSHPSDPTDRPALSLSKGSAAQKSGPAARAPTTAGATAGGGLGGRRWDGGPLTGDNFGAWLDRARDVEDLLDSPQLRDAVATARERARQLRRDYGESHRKPDWAVVELQVVRPLVEVRNRVAEDLARRERSDSLAPIDHDPVPARFAESVRRYYEELGRDEPADARQPHQP